jgi:hypothetical protein
MVEIAINGEPAAIKERKPDPPRVDFRFPEGGGVQPEGFTELEIGEECEVTLTGKVVSMSAPDGSEWNKDQAFALVLTGCRIGERAMGGGMTSMDEAIRKSRSMIE